MTEDRIMIDNRIARSLLRLHDIMATLRGPAGCPWDAVQTPDSLKPYLLEEAYEVLEALDGGNPEEICDELGDLLLQVVFHARIFAERGDFDLADVAASIGDKLVRRHPHVFQEIETADLESLHAQWERIKDREAAGRRERRRRIMDGIPPHLPALLKTAKVLQRAETAGRSPLPPSAAATRLRSLLDELEGGPGEAEVEALYGDLLLAAAALGRHLEVSGEDALRRALDRFVERLDTHPGDRQAPKAGPGVKERPRR